MGIFGGIMGASLWTGNAIHTALQNARTKKEIRQIYQNAADANFQNRSVAVLLMCMDENKNKLQKLSLLIKAAAVVSLAAAVFFAAYCFDNKYTSDGLKARNGVLLLDEQAQKEYATILR